MKYILLLSLILFSQVVFSQLTSSNLPIIKINTNGKAIFNDPKTKAEIGIIYNGQGKLNYLTDPPNEYKGYCGIEIRGESSQSFSKKSYLFEFWDSLGNDMDTSFLNFPPEEDFILYGPFSDKSLLNNVLAMKLGNDLGQYASRTRFVELIINNEYLGLYVVMEKIKRNKNRVDIAKLESDEIEGDDLTGGYIVRIDKGIYQGWESKYSVYNANQKLFFQYYYPDQNNLRTEQKLYIKKYMDDFEEAIASYDYTNSSGKRYTDYINVRSFVDNFIINELSKNVDAYRLSTYFHKDKNSKGGKLSAGPLWDFNLSFGNADYCAGDDINGWEYYQCPGYSPFWWDKMLKDDFFTSALKCRWESLRKDILQTDTIHAFLDSMTVEIQDAQIRNFQKWPILGTYIWPNPYYYSQAQNHEAIMSIMKGRLKNRAIWLDLNMPGIAENCAYYDEFDSLSKIDFVADAKEFLVNIYPNPTSGEINIESEHIISNVMIYNILGQVILTKNIGSNFANFQLPIEINPGTYLISIQLGGEIITKSLILK